MKKNMLWSSAPVAGLLLLASCGGGATDNKMAAEHMAMMKADSTTKAQVAAQEATARAITDMFSAGKADEADKLMAENFVDHQQDPSITSTGVQGAKEMVALVHTAYPDLKQEVLSISTTGDRTYLHLHLTATNTGPWGTMPATGKPLDVMAVDIIRFENGKAVEHWGYMEEMKMMQQMGLMPEPGAEEKKK